MRLDWREHPALFGADHREQILWVGLDEGGQAEVWVRGEDGKPTRHLEAFRPVAWVASGGPGAKTLAGNLFLGHLVECTSWSEFLTLLKTLKSAGQKAFAWTDPAQHFLGLTGKTLFKGMDFSDLLRLQIDIETDTTEGYDFPHPERDPLAAVALSDSTGWEEFIRVIPGDSASEKQAIEAVAALIAARDPDVIEGHNIFKFDLPFLAVRARKHKMKLLWGRGRRAASSRPSRLQIAERAIQFDRFTVPGRHVIDTWILAQHYDVATRELENFGLKSLAGHLGVREPDRVFLEGAEIFSAYRSGDPAFATYALQDVRETRAVAAALSRSLFEQARIFPFNYQDIALRGNATKIDALFLREYLRARHSIAEPPPTEPFEGGATDVYETGILENVWHCDAASLYPSVILAFGIGPKSDRLGLFSGLLGQLRTFRLEAKAAARAARETADRARLEALQGAFKILINSFYGYLGFGQGHFADFAAARDVAARGRQILGSMVDWLRAQGANVIEIDTDGIYFQPPNGATPEDLEKGMKQILPAGIEVEFGKRYKAMFSYKAKNYALLEDDGRVTIKGGALKSRGMEPYLRDYLEELIFLLLSGHRAAAGALEGTLTEKILHREIPVARLARTETLQDSPAAYQRKISASSRNRSAGYEIALRSGRDYRAGDQVRYYIAGDKKRVTAYEAARPLHDHDPDQPDENVVYYAGKLADLAAKFRTFTSEPDLFSSLSNKMPASPSSAG